MFVTCVAFDEGAMMIVAWDVECYVVCVTLEECVVVTD